MTVWAFKIIKASWRLFWTVWHLFVTGKLFRLYLLQLHGEGLTTVIPKNCFEIYGPSWWEVSNFASFFNVLAAVDLHFEVRQTVGDALSSNLPSDGNLNLTKAIKFQRNSIEFRMVVLYYIIYALHAEEMIMDPAQGELDTARTWKKLSLRSWMPLWILLPLRIFSRNNFYILFLGIIKLLSDEGFLRFIVRIWKF